MRWEDHPLVREAHQGLQDDDLVRLLRAVETAFDDLEAHYPGLLDKVLEA